MAGSFEIAFISNVTDRIETWAEQFNSETRFRGYLRACVDVIVTIPGSPAPKLDAVLATRKAKRAALEAA